MTGPFATGPVRVAARARGKGLEAVLAEGGEVDRQVDRAEDPLSGAGSVRASRSSLRGRLGTGSDRTYVLQGFLHEYPAIPRKPSIWRHSAARSSALRSCARGARPARDLAAAADLRRRARSRARPAARSGAPRRRPCTGVDSRSTERASTLITFSRRSSRPATSANDAVRTARRQRSYTGGGTITFATPTSSSSSMNTTPFAVAGRWRATTMPAIRTSVPSAIRASSSVRTSPSLELRAQHLDRMLAEGDPGGRVVGDDPLPGVERAQVGRSGEGEGQRQLGVIGARAGARRRWRRPAARARRAAAPRPPDDRAARTPPPRPAARGNRGSTPERDASSARLAKRPAALALGHQRPRLVLADALHVAEPDPHRGLTTGARLHRALDAAAIDVHRPHLDPRRCASWVSESGG